MKLNQEMQVSAFLVSFPIVKQDKIELELEVTRLGIEDSVYSSSGRILMILKNNKFLPELGAQFQFCKKIVPPSGERNPGEFDYQQYLKSNRIYGLVYLQNMDELEIIPSYRVNRLERLIASVKRKFFLTFNRLYGGKSNSVMKALLLGERGELSAAIKESFVKCGVIHALAISGLHIGYIIIILFSIFSILRLPYSMKIIAVISGLIFYSFLIGFKAPIVRATLMGSLLLIGVLIQRRPNILNTISFAALVILIIDPDQLFQASFQLSFSAVLSIIYLHFPLKKIFEKNLIFRKLTNSKGGYYIGALFLVSLSAQLGTLPIVVYYFNRIPIIAILLNIAVIPMIGVIIALGFGTIILSIVSFSLAQYYAGANIVLLNFLLKIIDRSAGIQYSSFEMYSIGILTIFIYYILLWLLINFDKKVYRKVFVILVLILLNAWVWHSAFQKNEWMQVVYFDVGQGDAAYISFPDGKNLLIDAGPNLRNFDAGEYFLVPYFKRNSIEKIHTVILSHADNDHIGGMPSVLRNINVDFMLDNGLFHETAVCSTYQVLIDSLDIQNKIAYAGTRLKDFSHAGVFILHPDKNYSGIAAKDVNNASVVVKIIYGKFSFLFPGDIEFDGENHMVKYGELLNADVLKVPHHGSKTSSSMQWLSLVNPKHAIFSLGVNNRFKFPSSVVVERYQKLGINIMRTDLNGAVIFRTNGIKLERVR